MSARQRSGVAATLVALWLPGAAPQAQDGKLREVVNTEPGPKGQVAATEKLSYRGERLVRKEREGFFFGGGEKAVDRQMLIEEYDGAGRMTTYKRDYEHYGSFRESEAIQYEYFPNGNYKAITSNCQTSFRETPWTGLCEFREDGRIQTLLQPEFVGARLSGYRRLTYRQDEAGRLREWTCNLMDPNKKTIEEHKYELDENGALRSGRRIDNKTN